MKTLGVIFSNIYDSSFGELTVSRSAASLPFGGRYRQIDFALSNMSNSGIYNIGIITKYNYRSLMDHLGTYAEWDLNHKNESVTLLPPFANGNTGIYKGKLEALYSAVEFIDNPAYDYVLLSDSTVLCNIDFRKALQSHEESGADVTIIANRKNDLPDEKHPLVITADKKGKVTSLRTDSLAGEQSFIGMGMFIVNRKLLVDAIEESFAAGMVHFERDFLQKRLNEKSIRLSLYEFKGVVLHNENRHSYFKNNLSLLDAKVRKSLFETGRPIYTKVRDEAPSYYGKGSQISECIVADGCTFYGKAKNSVIFRNVEIAEGAEVKQCIVMQGTRIGKGAKLECVILDKNVTVREGAVLKGTPEHAVIIKKGEIV